jgi:hypothetical protein
LRPSLSAKKYSRKDAKARRLFPFRPLSLHEYLAAGGVTRTKHYLQFTSYFNSSLIFQAVYHDKTSEDFKE